MREYKEYIVKIATAGCVEIRVDAKDPEDAKERALYRLSYVDRDEIAPTSTRITCVKEGRTRFVISSDQARPDNPFRDNSGNLKAGCTVREACEWMLQYDDRSPYEIIAVDSRFYKIDDILRNHPEIAEKTIAEQGIETYGPRTYTVISFYTDG